MTYNDKIKRFNKTLYYDESGNEYLVSRPLQMKQLYIPAGARYTSKNQLFDYLQDENGYKQYQENFSKESDLFCYYFNFQNYKWALERFYCLGSVWVCEKPFIIKNKKGQKILVNSVDMDGCLYDPYYLSFNDNETARFICKI